MRNGISGSPTNTKPIPRMPARPMFELCGADGSPQNGQS